MSLDAALKEVETHTGNVWTFIWSLRREDAARLGYDHAESWRKLIKAHQAEIAEAMKIPPDQLRWYAAFHDEGHHPHVHAMVWSADPKQGRLTKEGVKMARILENGKYTGGSGFPAVIPPEVYQKTLTQRKERAAPPTKTPAQKELRRLCGGNPPQYVEGQVLGVLNRLAANTSLIRTLDPPEDEPVQIRVLHRKLTDLLKEAPVDEAAARRTALDLAAQRLDAIGPEEYETARLRRVFEKAAPMESLDAELLRNSVRAITIQKRRAIVELKNGQIIEGGPHK